MRISDWSSDVCSSDLERRGDGDDAMLTFKVLSALLVYPEREVIDSLEEMAAIVDREALLPAAARADLRAFMETLKATDLMDDRKSVVSGKSVSVSVDLGGRRFIKKKKKKETDIAKKK